MVRQSVLLILIVFHWMGTKTSIDSTPSFSVDFVVDFQREYFKQLCFYPKWIKSSFPQVSKLHLSKPNSNALYLDYPIEAKFEFTPSPAPSEKSSEKSKETEKSEETGKKCHDWPQWRGCNRDGVAQETGLLQVWPENGPPLLWKVSNLGTGYSAPAVAQNRIFGLSYVDENEVVWALNEKNGEKLWQTKIGPRGKTLYNEGPRSTPSVDGDRVYVIGIRGDLVCLNAITGKISWRKSFPDDLGGKMMSNWGYCESPLVDCQQVVGTPGADQNALAAFDKMTGKILWRTFIPNCGGAGYSSIMPMTIDQQKIYITWLGAKRNPDGKIVSGKGLVAVNAQSGHFLWNYDRLANGTANIPTVLIHNDKIFCSNGYPEGGSAVLQCVRMQQKPLKFQIRELAYQPAKELQNHHGGLVLLYPHVYLGHGHKAGLPCCADFNSAKILWKAPKSPCRGSAAVISADNHLYFRYEDGTMCLIGADPKKYLLISQFVPPELSNKPIWSHPVIANGKLFLRDQHLLWCYQLRCPEKK